MPVPLSGHLNITSCCSKSHKLINYAKVFKYCMAHRFTINIQLGERVIIV